MARFSNPAHETLPLASAERLAYYLRCDCQECRRSMSSDAPVHLFARLLLIAPKAVQS